MFIIVHQESFPVKNEIFYWKDVIVLIVGRYDGYFQNMVWMKWQAK